MIEVIRDGMDLITIERTATLTVVHAEYRNEDNEIFIETTEEFNPTPIKILPEMLLASLFDLAGAVWRSTI